MVILNIQYIVQRENFLGGKPHITGTRISVHQVAILFERHQWPIDHIADEYNLTPAQIHAALSYYYDNKQTIDTEIQDADDQTEQTGKSLAKLVKQLGYISDEE